MHRTHLIRELGYQLNVSTTLTPAPSHLLNFKLVGCEKLVIKVINCPIMSLLGTRVGSTSRKRCHAKTIIRACFYFFPFFLFVFSPIYMSIARAPTLSLLDAASHVQLHSGKRLLSGSALIQSSGVVLCN
jgi:hypothetical protein